MIIVSMCPSGSGFTSLCVNPASRSSTRGADYFLLNFFASTTLSSQSRYNGGVSFRIRQFEKADFDTLWRIDQACFDPQLAYSRPELAFYMRRPGSFTLVAEGDGTTPMHTLTGEMPMPGSANISEPLRTMIRQFV